MFEGYFDFIFFSLETMKAWAYWLIIIVIIVVIVAIVWGVSEQNKRWKQADIMYYLMKNGETDALKKYIIYNDLK